MLGCKGLGDRVVCVSYAPLIITVMITDKK